jgi:iron-sulfur cluster repair protein YtfE (RIC family)
MSTYSLDDLIRKWKQGDLSQEQMIDHMVQQVKLLHDKQIEILQRVVEIAKQLAQVHAPATAPAPQSKRKGGR